MFEFFLICVILAAFRWRIALTIYLSIVSFLLIEMICYYVIGVGVLVLTLGRSPSDEGELAEMMIIVGIGMIAAVIGAMIAVYKITMLYVPDLRRE